MTYSALASPSATVSVLEEHGLYTRKRLGQHFLVDDNVVGRILDLAAIEPSDAVLEIGPGIGTLTVALCRRAGAVVAVERDERLLPALAATTAECPRLEVVAGDAVRVAPTDLRTRIGPPTLLVANLPYSVAATVVLRCFELLPTMRAATVMVQAEVADRICAEPGGKDYGAYTVKLRLFAAPGRRFRVAPRCFLPPPRVDSAVVRLDRVPPDVPEDIRAGAAAIADAAFSQRRKTLRNSLSAGLGIGTDEASHLLEQVDIDPADRAEALGVEDYVRLARAIRAG